MGKLSRLASVKSANIESFAYIPPPTAFDAVRILVNVEMEHLSIGVMERVLRGLRRANPGARILIVESAENAKELVEHSGLVSLMDDNMRATEPDVLQWAEYPNRLDVPTRYKTVSAPSYLAEYECCVTVATFKHAGSHSVPFTSAAVASLQGLLPRGQYTLDDPSVLSDVFFTIGHLFDGAVIELSEKVIWGDDVLAVDEAACQFMSETPPDYLQLIHRLRESPTK